MLRNAIKFTPVGGEIGITTGNTGQRVWVRIADSGIGFEAEASRRIFRTFEHADRSVLRNYGGLGLGLPISRSIMEAHGGTIQGESAGRGQGATFTMDFPVPSSHNPPPLPQPSRTPGLRILLVEDHKDTRACIQQVLELARHRVTSAASAEAALELAESDTFDLVISDLGLPDKSGHELMRQLRARYGLSGIALSGYGMKVDIDQSHAAGFKHHLTKPVSFDRLHALVAEFGRPRR